MSKSLWHHVAMTDTASAPIDICMDRWYDHLRGRLDGGFDARGLLFHMSGAWTVTFDIERDGVTERAQTIVELE